MATVDRDQPLAGHAAPRRILFDAGHGESPRRLDDRTGVLEHILDGCTDLVRIHEHDLIHVLAREREAFLADALHGNAIGEYADALLKGARPLSEQRPATGCNIKWKPGKQPVYYHSALVKK